MISKLLFIIPVVFLVGFVSVVNAQEFPELGVRVETVAENLNIPWEIEFTPDGRIFFTERIGHLRLIQDGNLVEKPITIYEIKEKLQFLGLVLDPNFEENHFLYLYYNYYDGPDIFNRVVRYTEHDNSLSDEMILLDKIPGSLAHNGGRIIFGPDGKLYITTGDANQEKNAQDLSTLAGKILRINSDGSIPKDNPFENSVIFSYGHRNPQGIDSHPDSGILVATEHGNEPGKDEINVIISGNNYGWPIVEGNMSSPEYASPLYQTGEEITWAPSGATFYDSHEISDWYGKYFVATLRGSHLRMLDLDLQSYSVESSEALFEGEFGRLRNAKMGPDGHLYILTSNADRVPNLYDKILRIVPIEHNEIVGDDSFPPLKQIQSKILPKNIACKDGLKLVFKASNDMPACVKISSVERLREIGWAK